MGIGRLKITNMVVRLCVLYRYDRDLSVDGA